MKNKGRENGRNVVSGKWGKKCEKDQKRKTKCENSWRKLNESNQEIIKEMK